MNSATGIEDLYVVELFYSYVGAIKMSYPDNDV